MTVLHWRIAALLVWLGFFFNVERLYLPGGEKVELSAWIYASGIAISLLPLLTLRNQRSLGWLIGMAGLVYAAGLIGSQQPLIGGIHTYLTLVSFFFVGVTLLLSYLVQRATQEFMQAVETITFSGVGGQLRNLNDARELVDTEIIRSRRTEHPLSLMVFQADPASLDTTMHQLVQEVQRSMMQRYMLTAVARVLARMLRRTDVILEDGKPGRLMLLIPETSEQEAQQLSRRIATIIQDRFGISGACAVASFPQQALTFDDLVSVVDQRLSQSLAANEIEPLSPDVLELNNHLAMERVVVHEQ